MLSFAHTDKYYQLFLSQGVGAGIGGGLVYIPALAVQAHHWRRYRPLAMGIVITGELCPSVEVVHPAKPAARIVDWRNILPHHAQPADGN